MKPGFYKLEGESHILYAPNSISGPGYVLINENKTDYSYPIDDWYWFDSETEAYTFFGLDITNKENIK